MVRRPHRRRRERTAPIWPILSLVALLSVVGCSGKTPLDPVLVGHVVPLSGPERLAGEHARHGILLAVEDANAGIDSTAVPPVRVLHADSRGEDMGPIATRLISVNGVAALLGGLSPSEIATLAAAAKQYNVPLVAPGTYEGAANDPYVFPTGLSPTCQGTVLAQFSLEELKAKRALIATNVDDKRPALDRAQSQAVSAAFAAGIRRAGGDVRNEFTYKTPDELKSAMVKARTDKPAAVLLAGVPEDLTALRTAGLEEKTSVLFAGIDGASIHLKSLRSADAVYMATAFASDGTPAAIEFSKKYQDRFGEPPDAGAGLAYDAARVLFDAIRRARGGDCARLRQALEEVKEFPALGGPLSWDARHQASRPAFVVRIEKGQVKSQKTYKCDAG
jgi:branched-chain amino acid transport system substrate-binding protein